MTATPALPAALRQMAAAFEALAAAMEPSAPAAETPAIPAEPTAAQAIEPAAPQEQHKAERAPEPEPFPARAAAPCAENRAALAARLAEALKTKMISRADVVAASAEGRFFKPSGVKTWEEFDATEKFLESFGA